MPNIKLGKVAPVEIIKCHDSNNVYPTSKFVELCRIKDVFGFRKEIYLYIIVRNQLDHSLL